MIAQWMSGRQVWLYQGRMDFRKQINGLVQVVLEEMGQRPTNGNVYLFRNQQRDKIKLLVWDRNGFVLGYKRLERGRFDLPIDTTGNLEMTWDQLWMLVSGMPMVHLGKDAEKSICFS